MDEDIVHFSCRVPRFEAYLNTRKEQQETCENSQPRCEDCWSSIFTETQLFRVFVDEIPLNEKNMCSREIELVQKTHIKLATDKFSAST